MQTAEICSRDPELEEQKALCFHDKSPSDPSLLVQKYHSKNLFRKHNLGNPVQGSIVRRKTSIEKYEKTQWTKLPWVTHVVAYCLTRAETLSPQEPILFRASTLQAGSLRQGKARAINLYNFKNISSCSVQCSDRIFAQWVEKMLLKELALKEKRVLKQCPWGTYLENGAFFDKKGTILVPWGTKTM